jgi:PAS domain S-box-containing protein
LAPSPLHSQPDLDPDDLSHLLHELRVHQEEVNIQNQQLIESQKLLENSRDRYVDLFDFAPVAIVTFCDNGVIREINLAAANLLGATRAVLLETPFIPFVLPFHRRTFLDHLRKCRGTRHGVVKTELVLKNRRGATLVVELSSNPPTPAPDGSPTVRYNSALVDLSERRAAEEQRERLRRTLESERLLRTVLETLPVGVRVVDPSGHIVVQNSADTRIWGDSAHPRVHWTAGRAWHVADDRPMASLDWPLARALAGEQVLNELLRLDPHDGPALIVRNSAVPLVDEKNEVLGALGVTEDITELWRTQTELRAAKDAAELAGRLKDEFLATVSHELRTPLSAVLLWAHLLRTGAVDESARTAALDTVYNSAKTQSQIIDDLLDLSRMIAGKLSIEPRPLELLPVVTQAMDSLRPAAAAKGLVIDVHADPDVSAAVLPIDPDRMRQVVWNLVNNAIKFTPAGGSVRVSLARVPRGVTLVVSDTGKGISKDFLPHVFERFRQADAGTTRTQSGLGLGLSIVKQIVEMHGGTVAADSPGQGMGATFTVRLPLADGRADNIPTLAPSDHPAAAGDALAGTHVLLVDDDQLTRDALHRLLENAGAVVTAVDSAPAALKALDLARPDVLLSDLSMPGEDGYSLIRKIRDREQAENGKEAENGKNTPESPHPTITHHPPPANTPHPQEPPPHAPLKAR